MYKRIITVLVLIFFTISLTACSNFNFTEIYFSHIHSTVPEEEWTDTIPAHRVQGGKELHQEIETKAKDALNAYFEEKYGSWIKIDKLHVLVDFDVETEGSILPVEIKHTPVFSGIVIAECDYKDSKFTAYVDTNVANMKCYDNYQGDEILQAVKDYFKHLDDTSPVIIDATIQPRNGMQGLYRGFENKFDLSNMTHAYFNGDMSDFLAANGFEGGLTAQCCYVSQNGLETASEAPEAFRGNYVSIYCFDNKEMLEHFDYSNRDITHYWPYLSGVAISDKAFLHKNQHSNDILSYIEPSLQQYGDLLCASPYSSTSLFNEIDTSSYDIYVKDNMHRWVQEVKESVVEETGEETIHRVEIYNVAQRVTSTYTHPQNGSIVFLEIDKIDGYDSSKVYKLCKYSRYEGEDKTDESFATDDLQIIGDYVVVPGSNAYQVWFIVEVNNPTK